nr:sulfotransferase family 2 domain-containing protein [Thiocapsa imhoffii]
MHGVIRPPSRLLFEHIPKCAGSTISSYLRSCYPECNTFEIDGAQPRKSIESFLRSSESTRYGYSLIMGHGAHQLISFSHPETIGFTVLRDPVDRIISHYYFVLKSPRHYLHQEVVSRRMSLIDYATSNLSGELRNNYVTRFIGVDAAEAERNANESVTAVIDALRRYAVVGVTDRVSLAIEKLSKIANLPNDYSGERHNVNRGRVARDQIPQETKRLIEEVNFLDMRLYEWVRAGAP